MISDTINNAQTVAGSDEGTLLAGRYRVVRQLGIGGMGSVWLAEDTQLDNKQFAIKMLPAILVSNKRAYRQLKDEALVAMRLVHPNIVQIRAFEENNGNPFLVMDYVDGETLDDYLAEHFPAGATPADVARPPRPCCKGEGALATSPGTTGGPPCGGLPEAEVIRILKPIAAALDYAHSKGVVHRDVKPGNVMIAKDGTPYILDFGIAREIQETMTRETGKLSSGTLLYMSPEQLMGEQPKPAQDIYSFSAMAYECLKGEPPFSHGQIEFQIMNKMPEPLVSAAAGGDGPPMVGRAVLRAPLAASVMAGLAKKPEGRPPTCAAVLEGGKVVSRRGAEAQRNLNSRAETAGRGTPTAPKIDVAGRSGNPLPAENGRARSPNGPQPQRGSRFDPAMTALAVALVLVGGYFGLMKYDDGVKRREAEAVRQKAVAEEVKRKAKEEARERAEREALERERRAYWRQEGQQFTIEPYDLAMTMKWCPAGAFMMGSPGTEEGRYDDETQHQVTLTRGFWMGETEVTQGQWKKIMDGETVVELARKGLQDDTEYMINGKKQTLREFWGMERYGDPMNKCGDLNDNVPIYNVNWYEAVEFCRRLTERERAEGHIPDGYEYRLPTEAEWEYACRAGTTTALPNGCDIRILGQNYAPALDDIAWYGGNSSVGFQGRGIDTSNWPERQYLGGRAFARNVKGKQPNNWGLYDMIGNVWEWCGDWYGKYEYVNQTDPVGAASATFRVYRGGSWDGFARSYRSASRVGDSPSIRYYNLGFRVALAPMLPEVYRKAIQEELQKANVVTRHEQSPTPEVKRERRPEKKAPASMRRSERDAHDKVQLWEGGPYWATTNIGAEKPWDYGYYFWWGDTVGYKWENDAWMASDRSSYDFSFGSENTPTFNKSPSVLRSEGWITADNVLAPEHDAAHVHWGGGWRMPTKQELEDLCTKCDWTWTTMNGVNGYVVRGRGEYASNSIFLPCAGFGNVTSLLVAGTHGFNWSSSPNKDAWSLDFDSSDHHTNEVYRGFGRSIRPVQGATQ